LGLKKDSAFDSGKVECLPGANTPAYYAAKKVFVAHVEMGKSKSLGVLKHGGLELPTGAGTIKL
jgi:hypothetical protein